MSNGAAGCGYEHRNTPGMCCPFLQGDLSGFFCLKYKATLKTARITGEPFRCGQCGEDADKHINSILAKRRAAENARVRNPD